MRMIVCTGSERPITQVLFNREDDLLFASSVDGRITLWNPNNGERLGTYDGHRGAVFAIDVDYMSRNLLSAGGDGTIRLWNVLNGKSLYTFQPNKNRITSVHFNVGDTQFLATTPQQLGIQCQIHIYKNPCLDNQNPQGDEKEDTESLKIKTIEVANHNDIKNFKISKALWSPLNNYIYCGCSDGTIRVFDVEKEEEIENIIFDPDFNKKLKTNNKLQPDITDIQYAINKTCIVATSRNTESRMYNIRTWECIKKYSTDRGLNTVAVHPNINCIAIGGGRSAQQAALERGKGDYDVLLENIIYEERMGIIDPECFSPLNTMVFNSDASLFVLGYEEGTVRIFRMDANFDEKWKKIEEKFISEQVDDDDDDDDDF